MVKQLLKDKKRKEKKPFIHSFVISIQNYMLKHENYPVHTVYYYVSLYSFSPWHIILSSYTYIMYDIKV